MPVASCVESVHPLESKQEGTREFTPRPRRGFTLAASRHASRGMEAVEGKDKATGARGALSYLPRGLASRIPTAPAYR
jgi:hypothetical protein